jgi:hypothetical protein
MIIIHFENPIQGPNHLGQFFRGGGGVTYSVALFQSNNYCYSIQKGGFGTQRRPTEGARGGVESLTGSLTHLVNAVSTKGMPATELLGIDWLRETNGTAVVIDSISFLTA